MTAMPSETAGRGSGRETWVAPVASIVLCTHNRKDLLRGAVRSLLADSSTVARELVVIDNASTDGTATVLAEELREAAIPARVVREEVLGHSAARNRGVTEASGSFLLFTDDDVTVEDGWADSLMRHFQDPTVGAVAGRILPSWPYAPPPWLEGPHAGAIALVDYGDAPRDLGPGEMPIGANMAVRRSALAGLDPPFDRSVGHRGVDTMGHDELQVHRHIRHLYRVVYEPSAVVHHNVEPARMSRSWMRRSFFRGGIGLARAERASDADLGRSRRVVRLLKTTAGARGARRDNDTLGDEFLSAEAAYRELSAFMWAGKHLEMVIGRRLPGFAERLADLTILRADRDGTNKVAVVSTFPPRHCGIGRYADQLAFHLAASASVKRLALPGGDGDVSLDTTSMLWPLKLLLTTRGCRSVWLMWHPSFYFHGRLPRRVVTGVLLAPVLRRRHAKVVVHETDMCAGTGDGHSIAQTVHDFLTGLVWRHSAVLLFHTESERQAFLALQKGVPPSKTRLLPHGSSFAPAVVATRLSARRRLGIPDDIFAFLCIGFIGHHKGFDRAVRAFASANSAALSGPRLYVIGSGLYDTDEVRACIADLRDLVARVPGATLKEQFVDDTDFDYWIQAADVLIAPYRQVFSSSVVARAKLLGTPVVVSSVGGLPEQVDDTDWVVASDTELQQAIAALLASPDKRAG